MPELKVAERADLDITIKGNWRESSLKVEGVNLPVTDMELSCEVNDVPRLSLQTATKQTTTVVEGFFVEDLEPWLAKWDPPWLRMEFGRSFVHCRISIDGEDIMAMKMWARLNVPEATEVGFTRLIHNDYENTYGPPLRGFHDSFVQVEYAGYLVDEIPESKQGE